VATDALSFGVIGERCTDHAAFGVNRFSSLQPSTCESIIRDMLSKIAIRGLTACILLLTLAATNALAHHSFAPHFDASKTGTIRR